MLAKILTLWGINYESLNFFLTFYISNYKMYYLIILIYLVDSFSNYFNLFSWYFSTEKCLIASRAMRDASAVQVRIIIIDTWSLIEARRRCLSESFSLNHCNYVLINAT